MSKNKKHHKNAKRITNKAASNLILDPSKDTIVLHSSALSFNEEIFDKKTSEKSLRQKSCMQITHDKATCITQEPNPGATHDAKAQVLSTEQKSFDDALDHNEKSAINHNIAVDFSGLQHKENYTNNADNVFCELSESCITTQYNNTTLDSKPNFTQYNNTTLDSKPNFHVSNLTDLNNFASDSCNFKAPMSSENDNKLEAAHGGNIARDHIHNQSTYGDTHKPITSSNMKGDREVLEANISECQKTFTNPNISDCISSYSTINLCMNETETIANLDNKDTTNVKHSTDLTSIAVSSSDTFNDTSNNESIYLSNIYSVICTLSKKFDRLQTKNSIQDSFSFHYKNIYKYLILNQSEEAKNYLKAICKENFESTKNKFEVFLNVKNLINLIQKKFEEVKNEFETLKNENEKIINEKNEKYKKVVDFLVSLQNMLKNNKPGESKMATDKACTSDSYGRDFIESNSKTDIFCKGGTLQFNEPAITLPNNTNSKVSNKDFTSNFVNKSISDVISGSEIKLFDLQNNFLDFESVKNEIQNLITEKLHENLMTQKLRENEKLRESLENENLKLQQKNAKLKKDFVILNNELILQKEGNKKRQNVIEKQKKIIQVLQNKFENEEDSFSFVNLIEKKIKDLRIEIENENDQKKRFYNIQELNDLEKRLQDYLKLSRK